MNYTNLPGGLKQLVQYGPSDLWLAQGEPKMAKNVENKTKQALTHFIRASKGKNSRRKRR